MEEAQRPIARHDGVLAAGAQLLRFEGLTLDLAGRTLSAADGHEIPLTRAEFVLLSVLIRNCGRALSRDQLLDAVAGRRAEPFDRSVDVLVGRLRRKIEPEPKAPRLVLTVPGHGYKFAAKPLQLAAEQEQPIAQALATEEPSSTLASPITDRRQLTVMVCTLSGATASPVRLDPEERHGIVSAFRTCCGDVCSQFGGVLGTVVGDTVHVYFGYPVAHEHDAERAIRAGLAVVEAVPRLDVCSTIRLGARVGIATGEAVLGDGPLAGCGKSRKFRAACFPGGDRNTLCTSILWISAVRAGKTHALGQTPGTATPRRPAASGCAPHCRPPPPE